MAHQAVEQGGERGVDPVSQLIRVQKGPGAVAKLFMKNVLAVSGIPDHQEGMIVTRRKSGVPARKFD
jgi:hypothetical protein